MIFGPNNGANIPDPRRINDNLLVVLYRLAHRQQENFTTESFAHLLQHLVDREPQAAVRILDWLTGSSYFSTRGSLALWVRTQDRTVENGIPDIRVEADDVDVIVEVKLGGDLTREQLMEYAKELQSARAFFVLVGLVGRKSTFELPSHTVVRTWGDLGVKLREEARSSQAELTRYLIDQFVFLLNHLHLSTLKISSELSAELSAHGQWSEANPEAPSVFRSRIMRIDRLGGMPHLGPLRQLLLQMDRVLSKAQGVKRRRFDSGPNMAQPWIGFNVNDMAYFFYVSLTRPETVWLQRYGRGVDPASFDGSFGALEIKTPTAVTSWKAQFDLLEPALAFFSQNEVVQEKYIGDFFERAFAFGETLRPLTAPAPLPDDVRHFVDATPWTFAKTYAATWPHEYVVRNPENAAMLLALARHIFEHGVEGRFYSSVNRYHHEGGKVYWCMAPTPESSELVNRCEEAGTYEARLAAGTLPK